MTEWQLEALTRMEKQVGAIVSLLERLVELQSPKSRSKQATLPLTVEGLPRVAEIWNKWAHEKFPRVADMSPASARYKKTVERWREKPNEEYWVRVINRINRSSFCQGKNDRQWIADIEFLIRPDTHSRVLEGKFDDKTEDRPAPRVYGYVTMPDGSRVEVLK